ncbi:alpha/beta hydrolase [Agromyces sp. H66]|uniref:alpha/beta fold hydrolase n=1 Tax=Agromyces sp. H66 TaxID=2529859 RepID=UPI0010AB01CE|nr:alpha/beta hydrolase [Agromyces sp. H66]
MRASVIFLPGIILPADLAFAVLREELPAWVDPVVKDLEIYAHGEPPADYGLDLEIEGVLRAADEARFERFHLMGYSGGGAVAFAFTAAHPERIESLALLEPAWLGNDDMGPGELRTRAELDEAAKLPPDARLAEFTRIQLAPGVEPPPRPDGPAPEWMRTRPAGIAAIMRAFARTHVDVDVLRAIDVPVYYALGGRSNADFFGEMAERCRSIFSDFTLEVFPERHHFDPPHRIEPERLVSALEALWERASRAR